MKSLAIAAAAVALACSATAASAGTLQGQEPDASVIVTRGDLEWVWASPCAGVAPSCGVPELHHGFEFATEEQWLSSFTDLADLIAAFTSPLRCASTYFSTYGDNCDEGDLEFGAIWDSPFMHPFYLGDPNIETFLVRSAGYSEVPEPATLALFGLGLVGMAAARRRRPA